MTPLPLQIFGRAPVAGRVKTRLAPALGEEGAAALYRAFLEDVIARASGVPGARVELFCAGDVKHPALIELSERYGVPLRAQPEGDLGRRMLDALERGLETAGRVVLIGSDSPTLPGPLLRRATRALEGASLVLGPAHDGGYYLIGARRLPRLDGIRWSSAAALEDTIARNADRSIALLPPWYDVDEPEDLRLLRLHLTLRPGAAPKTAALLAGL